ncbi:MAG: GIY-YIG nuclease family protein [Patescibacteria group bacterium]
MFYLYILRNKNGKFYVGSTNNLKRRFSEHNSGKVFSTKRGVP